ncbi:Protein of unknown function [Cotesia congregata]|uniref:Uncharacterized protein n=1 Tax=Cotesia congregata TaxID=51543 RepID=A0A8J2EKY7_COTCN|nr:Protein of unknown function [Cotesia congregata]
MKNFSLYRDYHVTVQVNICEAVFDTREITFENCQKNEWWIKNISPSLPIDNKINFEAEIGIGEILVNWTQNGTNLHTMSVKKLKNGCVKNVQTVGGEKKKPLAPGSVLQPFIKSIPMNPALTK